MSPAFRTALTIAIFAATVIAIVTKPRGLHEAWSACLGACAFLGLGFVSRTEAIAVASHGKSVLLFLFSLLVLAALVDASGFFAWAAMHAARRANGSSRRLFRNVFLLGSLVTFVLSLDTTAVLLTPIVLSFCKRFKLPALPYVIACAFVSNAASLALPVSNLTNLLLIDAVPMRASTYVARMALPQIVVLLVVYAGLARHFRTELARDFETDLLEEPRSLIPHVGYFRACAMILGVAFVLFALAPMFGVPPYAIGLGAAAFLALYGFICGRVSRLALRKIPVGLLPFVLGLFVCVKALENLGLASYLARALAHVPLGIFGEIFAHTALATAAANASNNLPATLLFQSILDHTKEPALFASLLGVNVGPNLFPFASLATMLVLSLASARGTTVGATAVLRAGLRVTPLALGLSAFVLWLSYVLVP